MVEDLIWEKITRELKEPFRNTHVDEYACCQVQYMMEVNVYALRKEMKEIHATINNDLKFPNGKLTHVGLERMYMFVLCLLVASCSQEHFKGNALDPRIPALGEKESKEQDAKKAYGSGEKSSIASNYGSYVSTQQIDTAYADPLDTAYQPSDTVAEADSSYLILVLDFRILSEEDTTRIMTELNLKECMKKAQAESSFTKPNTNDVMNIKLNKEFLMNLQSNAYHGMFDEDVIDHIAKVLEILDLVETPCVDSHRLRMKVFYLSLADDARQLWIN
ncbi:hypothetical protein Tco_0122467 [Tanacetum coccineum]